MSRSKNSPAKDEQVEESSVSELKSRSAKDVLVRKPHNWIEWEWCFKKTIHMAIYFTAQSFNHQILFNILEQNTVSCLEEGSEFQITCSQSQADQ